MTIITTEKYKCDICGLQQEGFMPELNIPIYRTFDDTDGLSKYSSPVIINSKVHLCPTCIKRVVIVQDVGVQCTKLRVNPMKNDLQF